MSQSKGVIPFIPPLYHAGLCGHAFKKNTQLLSNKLPNLFLLKTYAIMLPDTVEI